MKFNMDDNWLLREKEEVGFESSPLESGSEGTLPLEAEDKGTLALEEES